MITIIVEDGTGLADANSYATLAYVKTYAEEHGATLPTDDETIKQYMIQAMDYIASFSSYMRGVRTTKIQSLDYPRSGVYIYGNLNAYNIIPVQLMNAQAQLVCDIQTSGPLFESTAAFATKSIKVGPITIERAIGSNTTVKPAPSHPLAMSYLSLLFAGWGSSRTVR